MKKWSWLLRWTRIIGGFAVLQALVQIVNGVTGFLLVRAMGKEDYAWFTIANSLLATISILTDSGLGSAMSSIGGSICQDRPRFAELMAVMRRFRMMFMLASLAVTLPAGVYVLNLNHAPPWTTALLGLIIVVSAIPSAESALLGSANRLHSRLRQILQTDSATSLTRLILVFLGRYAGMGAVLASLITTISLWVQWFLLRRQTRDLSSVPHENTGAFRKPTLNVVKHTLPLCIFQTVQGHIATWVLSIFANTSTVADVGALSRLGFIVTFLILPVQNIVLPMIARAGEPARLRRLSLLAIMTSVIIAVLLVIVGMIFSHSILWVLGPQYGHLHMELIWYLGYVALGFFSHVLWGIVLTRSWVKSGWLHIPLTIITQIAGAFCLDLSTAVDAIIFSSMSQITGILIACFLIWRGLKNASRQASMAP